MCDPVSPGSQKKLSKNVAASRDNAIFNMPIWKEITAAATKLS